MTELGARSRNQAEKEQRRAQILQAALEEFRERGMEAATMSSIAQRAGQSRGLVNFYFGDKAGLYNALEREALNELGDYFANSVRDDQDGLTQITNIIRAYIGFYREQPGYFHLLGSGEDETTALGTPLGGHSRNAISYVVEAIIKGRNDGTLRQSKTDPTMAAVLLWSATHGCITIADRRARILKAHWSIDAGDFLESSVDFLVASLDANPK